MLLLAIHHAQSVEITCSDSQTATTLLYRGICTIFEQNYTRALLHFKHHPSSHHDQAYNAVYHIHLSFITFCIPFEVCMEESVESLYKTILPREFISNHHLSSYHYETSNSVSRLYFLRVCSISSSIYPTTKYVQPQYLFQTNILLAHNTSLHNPSHPSSR